jgi:hypothetical protein
MEDKTEFQTDRQPNVPGVPKDGPARKWFYQRVMAGTSFACICWWPAVLHVSPGLDTMTIPWFSLHGAVVLGWMGVTQWNAARK